MKYLSKDPIFCTPSTEDYEKSWNRVFGTIKKSSAMEKSENALAHMTKDPIWEYLNGNNKQS